MKSSKESSKPSRSCKFCGKHFQPKKSWQSFCCHKCQIDYNTIKKNERARRRRQEQRNNPEKVKMCTCCGIRPRSGYFLCYECWRRPPAGYDVNDEHEVCVC